MKLSGLKMSLVNKLHNRQGSVSFGGDPEYFISNSRGKILNADAFFPGKENPLEVNAHAENVPSKLFFDGIQAEMAFSQHVCREYAADNIKGCWKSIFRRIPKGHKVVLKPSARIHKDILEVADPEARRFGCAPDLNAYTCTTNTPEMDASRHPFRYAGGHIHLGLPNRNYIAESDPYKRMASTADGHLRIIKFLDLIVTIPTLLLDNTSAAKRRRSKYGKAGCFRPTPYGVEYRTPSCWWLKSPITFSIVTGLARLAWTIVGLELEKDFMKALKIDEDTIRGCIDESDGKTVSAIWEKLMPYIALSGITVGNPLHIGTFSSSSDEWPSDGYRGTHRMELRGNSVVYTLPAFEYMLRNGVDSIISNDVKKEWGIGKGNKFHNGAQLGMYYKLRDNEDYASFQESFLTDFFN